MDLSQISFIAYMLGLAIWLFLAIFAAYVASERGRSAFGFFLFSLALSYPLAILTLIALPKVNSDMYPVED